MGNGSSSLLRSQNPIWVRTWSHVSHAGDSPRSIRGKGQCVSFRRRRPTRAFGEKEWMANALIESTPPSGYPAVPAGVLDRDTAWTAFLVHRLGLPDGRPDAVSLLRWTLDPQQAPRFESLDSTARQGVRDRLKETAGAVGGAVADCLEARTAHWRFRLAWRWASFCR